MELPTTIALVRRRQLLALGTSLLVHGLGVALLIAPSRERIIPELSRLSPVLYQLAFDRRPGLPREFDLAPPAAPDAPVPHDAPLPTALELVAVPAPDPTREPAFPPGVLSVDLDTVFSMIAVDSEVTRDPASSAPAYPLELLGQGVEGEVEAEFVVDTTGWVDLATVRLVFSSHEAFSRSVEAALPGMHFRPAWRGARKVRQLVQQRFAFRFLPSPAERAAAQS